MEAYRNTKLTSPLILLFPSYHIALFFFCLYFLLGHFFFSSSFCFSILHFFSVSSSLSPTLLSPSKPVRPVVLTHDKVFCQQRLPYIGSTVRPGRLSPAQVMECFKHVWRTQMRDQSWKFLSWHLDPLYGSSTFSLTVTAKISFLLQNYGQGATAECLHFQK